MATPCAEQSLVDRHFAGRIRPEQERRLRQHLDTCAACRERYERHLLLSRLDPRAPDARTRLARGLGLDASEPRPPWLAFRPALLVAIAACLAVLVVRGPWLEGTQAPDGFTARGGQPLADALTVYAVGPQGTVAPVGEALAANQELAFAYRNPHARRYLMVFGVDEAGRVYWYHPSWTDATEDPEAVAISPGDSLHELPEAISQPLTAGRLTLHGVFLDSPMTVRQMEALLAEARGADVASVLPPDTDVTSLELQVHP